MFCLGRGLENANFCTRQPRLQPGPWNTYKRWTDPLEVTLVVVWVQSRLELRQGKVDGTGDGAQGDLVGLSNIDNQHILNFSQLVLYSTRQGNEIDSSRR